jgi:hypothetical protein
MIRHQPHKGEHVYDYSGPTGLIKPTGLVNGGGYRGVSTYVWGQKREHAFGLQTRTKRETSISRGCGTKKLPYTNVVCYYILKIIK